MGSLRVVDGRTRNAALFFESGGREPLIYDNRKLLLFGEIIPFAESERYLPTLITALEDVMIDAGIRDDGIVIRSTGCPNGCGRPYLAEIGLVGKAPGIYNLYLGAGRGGHRLNKLFKEAVNHDQIVELLTPIIRHYAKGRGDGEPFGDFVIRAGYVAETLRKRFGQFHEELGDTAFVAGTA